MDGLPVIEGQPITDEQFRQMEQQEIEKQLASVPISVAQQMGPPGPPQIPPGPPQVPPGPPQLSSPPPTALLPPPPIMPMVTQIQNQSQPPPMPLPSLLSIKITPPNMPGPNDNHHLHYPHLQQQQQQQQQQQPPPQQQQQLPQTPQPQFQQDSQQQSQQQQMENEIDEHESTDEIVKLPAALEQALAFKNERAKEVGADPNELTIPGTSPIHETSINETVIDFVPEPELTEKSNQKPNKTGKKKKKKKRKKHPQPQKENNVGETPEKVAETEDLPEVEYIQDLPEMADLPPMHRVFARVFEAFRMGEPDAAGDKDKGLITSQFPVTAAAQTANKILIDEFDEDAGQPQQHPTLGENGQPRRSKRELKRTNRLTVAELKQLVSRPDVVEMHDVTARDPKLLVHLKAYRNTVPVPRHWCFKRKYLQGKRGIEKPPFDLPDFIKRTGITEMRASLQERDESKTLKAKMREHVRPKVGKMDIDYNKLHDAFFKWQTKPRMTIHGDLYYEGKEFETRLKEKKPGELSDEARTALGMPVGPNAHKVPPPWLIAMQRYGPQPSYPNLKIPGLNAPIPEGCLFGYHAGGWGKPPVDETGRPLYGDVFGVARAPDSDLLEEEIDRTLWGEPESESSGDEDDNDGDNADDDDDDGEGKDGDGDASGLVTPGAEGLITPSGITSMPAGLETPDSIELRKKKAIESEMEGGDTPALYTVLQERRTEGLGASMMGSTHVYDMTGAGGQAPPSVIAARRGVSGETRNEKEGAVEITLDASELDLDPAAMTSRYDESIRTQNARQGREDFSDMLQDHVQRQKSKRKRQQGQETKSSKKYKDFKF